MKCLLFIKFIVKNGKCFFPCPGGIATFSSLIIDGNSETKADSFDLVLCMFNGYSTELYFVLFEIIFCEYFQQYPDVYQCLNNLSFLCLRSLLKWKYPHKMYCVL